MKKTYRFPINPIVGIKTVFLLLVILAAGILYLKIQEPAKRSADFTRLQQESYQGVFFSMYAPEAFPEDIYPTYMGYDAVGCSHRIASFSDLSDYLETAFSSDNEVTHVFLMLDPLLLWDSSLHQNALFTASLEEKLLAYVDTYAGAEFTVIFSTPSLAYWQSHADDDLDTYCNVIRILAASLSARENVTLHFPGQEEWLISNPDAYDTPRELNAVAARSTMLLVLSGAMRYLETESYSSLARFSALVQQAASSPVTYPDLSDYDLVFFGDSVIGNYKDFTSIPGVINALTGARVHNLAVGGSTATLSNGENASFNEVVGTLVNASGISLPDDDKLCFVINYGLNDYFDGYPLENYCDGLRSGIRTLRDAYPNAHIFVISSNYILSFEKGTAPTGDEENVLADYVAAAEETAAAEGVDFLNINEVLQWDADNAAEYLVDTIHPNEEGRWLFGVAVVEAFLSRYSVGNV